MVHIGTHAENAIEAINPYAIQKDVKINLNDFDNVEINADPGDMEILFNNLISNAVKYNIDNGTVDVILKAEKGKVKIHVKDTGIGMDESEANQLFDEFFRVKNEQTKHITGSGLGLTIVKRFIDLYNGEINVESKVGIGSTFTILLPM